LLPIPCGAGLDSVVDFISWGTTPCGQLSDSWTADLSITRLGEGCTDTDQGTDFVLATPIPHNSTSFRNPCTATADSALPRFAIPQNGGSSAKTTGTGPAITGGFARLERASGSQNPTGFAIFGLRLGGTLISEASVPAGLPMTSGLFYVESAGNL